MTNKKPYLTNLKTLIGKRVRVYRNLTHKCFSVKCKKTNRVIAHVSSVHLQEATFPVSKKLRQRVLESGHKNVHAFVEGVIIENEKDIKNNLTCITYNPRKKDHFFICSSEEEIKSASYVLMDISSGVYALAD